MSRRRRRMAIQFHDLPTFNDVARLWAFRLLLNANGYRKIAERVMQEQELFDGIGVPYNGELPPPAKLKRLLEKAGPQTSQPSINELDVLGHNLELLQRGLSLTDTDCRILAFIALLLTVPWLNAAADSVGAVINRDLVNALAVTLELPFADVKQALSRQGTLVSAGLLGVEVHPCSLDQKLVLVDGLLDALFTEQADLVNLLERFFHPGPPAALTDKDYPHVRDDWMLARRYVRAVKRRQRPGINILIHGRPGTGKTEFVRALAASLKLKVCEVNTLDSDGDPLSGERRVKAYLLAQRILHQAHDHVVLFDEVEDVFPNDYPAFFPKQHEKAVITKGAMNRILESNPRPAFWLCNQIRQIDPAYLRRFDMVIEMPPPTRAVRLKMLQNYLQGVPTRPEWRARLAANEDLMPAQIERAAQVVRALKPKSAATAERQLEMVFEGNLRAMGHHGLLAPAPEQLIPYNLAYLNPDVDLAALAAGLKRGGYARLCLYGPPGTGKSAFGRYLAETLDRPLLVKRASDILSMWVGETEHNIAKMFQQARREKAVLLLDEADGFLQDRSRAVRTWEITQVNELLTQMEAFEGLFIASTNLVDQLDAASLRRFDFKVKFDYLTPGQRRDLLAQVCQQQEIAPPDDAGLIQSHLDRLDLLTPGDFAVVLRKALALKNAFTAAEWIDLLKAECKLKPGAPKSAIGFM